MGKRIGAVVGGRLGKVILELGGNNAIIVDNNSNMDLVLPAIAFVAVGTAGQRCSSTRTIIAHSDIYDTLVEKLISAYLEQYEVTEELLDTIYDLNKRYNTLAEQE